MRFNFFAQVESLDQGMKAIDGMSKNLPTDGSTSWTTIWLFFGAVALFIAIAALIRVIWKMKPRGPSEIDFSTFDD